MLAAQCPDCSTRFRITSSQLRAAGGWARCGQCGAVFDAMRSLEDWPPPVPPEEATKAAPSQADGPESSQPLAPQRLDQQDDPPEHELLDSDPGFDLPLADPQDQTPEQMEAERAQLAPAPTKPMPFDIPPGLPDLEPASLDETEESASGHARWAWPLGSLLLVLALFLQLAWFEREQLIYHPLGRSLLQGMCRLADCRLPPRRDLERLEILGRDIYTQPGSPPQLQLRLVFANLAEYPQPYPRIQLSLFSATGTLEAQRVFLPTEYLPATPRGLMLPREQVQIELLLQEPAVEVSGFQFAFL